MRQSLVPLICAKVERWIYLIPDEYNLKDINAAQAILAGELGKTHHHELVSAFELDGMSVAIVSLYAFVKLISRYERHYLSEYGLSLIHDFYLLQYYLQKYKIKSRKNFIRVMH